MHKFTDYKFLAYVIDGLMAYDAGCKDSGIKDEELKKSVKGYLESLNDKDYNHVLALIVRDMLTDERLAQGYGYEDVVDFIEWIKGLY